MGPHDNRGADRDGGSTPDRKGWAVTPESRRSGPTKAAARGASGQQSKKRAAQPAGLGAAGRKVWRDVLAAVAPGWSLDERDLLLLREVARQADLIARLERAIDREGVLTVGAKGQPRVHGAVSALAQQRALFARLIGQLQLGPPEPKTGALNRRQRADLRMLMSPIPAESPTRAAEDRDLRRRRLELGRETS